MKIRLFTMAGIIFLFVSCNEKKKETGMSETAQKNLNAMLGIIGCFDKRDFTNLGDYVAEDCFDHYGEGLKGLAAMKAEYETWLEYTQNSKIKVITQMANDEYAIVWIRFEETVTQDVENMEAGVRFDKTDIEVGRLKDGKVVEHWTFVEPSEMAKVIQIPEQK